MKVYLDLDGVLADFDRHFKDTFGTHPNAVSDKVLWQKIGGYDTFFLDLPLMPEAVLLFNFLNVRFDVSILTACPKSFYQKAALQKRLWVRRHLSTQVTVLPVMGGKNKGLFMHDAGDLLIDDMTKNCQAWDELGGKSIIHFDAQTTMGIMKKLMAAA